MNLIRMSLVASLSLCLAAAVALAGEASTDAGAADVDPLKTYPMQSVAPTAAAILGVPAPKQAEAPAIDRVVQDLRGARGVAVLGLDAFGSATWDKARDRTPYLNGLANHNNRAQLRSVLRSATPFNFGCMITGASPKITGIENFDSKIQCEDLFNVLRKHGMSGGGFGRKGYTGDRLLGRYADFRVLDKETDADVLAGLMEIVDQKKPEFIIVQYGETDNVFHAHGPFSPQAADACADADAWLAQIVPWLRVRGYGVIITADHGQHEYKRKDGTIGGAHGSDSDLDCLVPLVWLPADAPR